MIRITMCIDAEGALKELTAEGHAGFDKKGQDIICASVSILLHAAYVSLYNLKDVRVSLHDEELYTIKIDTFDTKVTGELRGITLFLRAGIEALARNYADYINVSIK